MCTGSFLIDCRRSNLETVRVFLRLGRARVFKLGPGSAVGIRYESESVSLLDTLVCTQRSTSVNKDSILTARESQRIQGEREQVRASDESSVRAGSVARRLLIIGLGLRSAPSPWAHHRSDAFLRVNSIHQTICTIISWLYTDTMPRQCAEPVHTCAWLTEPVTSLRTHAQIFTRLCRHAHNANILCTPVHKISGFVTDVPSLGGCPSLVCGNYLCTPKEIADGYWRSANKRMVRIGIQIRRRKRVLKRRQMQWQRSSPSLWALAYEGTYQKAAWIDRYVTYIIDVLENARAFFF
jgi:hypothetical protein